MLKNGNITLLGEIRGLKPQRLAADPETNVLRPGLMWVNTTEKALKWFDGDTVNRIATGDSLDEYARLEGADFTGAVSLALDATDARHAVPLSQLTTALEDKQDSITGAASTIVTENLTAGAVLVADEGGKVAASSITTAVLGYLNGVESNVQEQLDGKQEVIGYEPVNTAGDNMTGNLDFGGNSTVTGLRAPSAPTDAARMIDLDNMASGLDFQPDVLAVQLDDTLVPTDDAGLADSQVRYIITDPANLNAAFGTIEGLEANDIIERDGEGFRVAYDVSEQGPGVLAWDRGTGRFVKFNGTLWNEHGGLSGVTAASGLVKDGNTISVDFGGGVRAGADSALTLDVTNGLALVDRTTGEASEADDAVLALRTRENGGLSVTAAGVGIGAEGVTAAMLDDAAFGNGLTGGAGTAVSVRPNADGSIVVDADGVRVGDLGDRYLALDAETASFDGQLAVPAPTADTSVVNRLFVNEAVAGANDTVNALVTRFEGSRFVFDGTNGDALDTYSINHNFGDRFVTVSVYDENDAEIMPDTVQLVDANTVQVTLAVAQRIRVVVMGQKTAAVAE